MFSNRLAFAALALACISAAAGGAYLATRQNAVSVTPVAATAPASTAKPVQETEAVVGDTTRTSLPAEAQPSTPAERPAAPAPTTPKHQDTRTTSHPAPRPARPTTTTAENAPLPTLDRSWPSGSASAP